MKHRKNALLCLLLTSILLCTACTGKAQTDATGRYALAENGEAIVTGENLTAATVDDNARVFYEIFVGSFSDSDGDGVGDLRGIINRFDYLNDGDPDSGLSLGVEGIWLTPIFRSPSYHKYDTTDYYTVDPAFGTEEDLVELIELCHDRGVKLILDLVINHTGSLNQWFLDFIAAHRAGDTESPDYDTYSFYSGATGTPQPGHSYNQLSGTGDYYECNFSASMPELNYDSETVRRRMLDVAEYYLALGVDGFRFDAAKYIYFGDNAASAAFWDWYIAELRAVKPDVYTVAEVWDSDGVTNRYYGATDCFDFTVSQSGGTIAEAAKRGNVNQLTAYVASYIAKIQSLREDAMFIPFLSNHDMDRAAGFLTVANGDMQMAANLYLLSPGSPFIYYGEELGMRGSRGGANTDANRRLAMLWGDGDTVADPEGATYSAANQTEATAANSLGDGDSLYNYYKTLLMIRRANPEIARGAYKALPFTDTKLGGFTATYEGSTVAVLHNTTMGEITVDLADVTDVSFTQIRAIIGQGSAALEGTALTLSSQTSVVLK